jgi:fructosamine-3-kinase
VAGGERHHVKRGEAAALPMLEAEAEGLAALAATGTVRVPQVISCGLAGGEACLVVEHLELRSLDRAGGAALGRQLAALHRHTHAKFGWAKDNFIGLGAQPNGWLDNWPRFYAEKRLRPQLALARSNGADRRTLDGGEELAEKIAAFFIGGHPVPSLLHGDLWGGNAGQLPDGTPVVFDPACYYGDREADLAMSELFGGFPDAFHAAYREAWPLAEGYETRRTLYNLYHVLNHFNIFGAGYLGQAQRMVGKLLAELRG